MITKCKRCGGAYMSKQMISEQGSVGEVEKSCLNCGHTEYVVTDAIRKEFEKSLGMKKVLHGRYLDRRA